MIQRHSLETEIQEFTQKINKTTLEVSLPDRKAKLQDIIKSDDIGLPSIIKFIHKFHPDEITRVISENWNVLSDDSRYKFVSEIIKLPKKDNDVKLKLLFVAQLVIIDPTEAFRIFSYTCEQLSEKNSKAPSARFIKLMRPILLNSVPPQLVSLPLDRNYKRDLEPIMIAGLLAAFAPDKADKELISPEVQYHILKWIFSNDRTLNLTEGRLKDIAASIDKWPLSLISLLQGLISVLPEELRKIITERNQCLFTNVSITMNQSVLESTNQDRQVDDKGVFFDPHSAMEKLADYIKGFSKKEESWESIIRQQRDKVREIEDKLLSANNRIDILSRKNDQLEDGKEYYIDLVNREKENNVELSNRISKLNEELNAAKEQAQRLSIDIEKMRSDHNTEMSKLVERIHSESEYAVGVLRTRLKSSLLIEHSDFNSIFEKPMSLELGDSLRSQVKRIFKKLNDEGIDFNGRE